MGEKSDYQAGIDTGHKNNAFREKLWLEQRDELLTENTQLREELVEMAEAVVDNQWDMDPDEENHWCHFCGSQICGPHEDCPVDKAKEILKRGEG